MELSDGHDQCPNCLEAEHLRQELTEDNVITGTQMHLLGFENITMEPLWPSSGTALKQQSAKLTEEMAADSLRKTVEGM